MAVGSNREPFVASCSGCISISAGVYLATQVPGNEGLENL